MSWGTAQGVCHHVTLALDPPKGVRKFEHSFYPPGLSIVERRSLITFGEFLLEGLVIRA